MGSIIPNISSTVEVQPNVSGIVYLNGEFVTINELANTVAEILNFNLDPIYMPGRPQEVKHANCSADLARKMLGYEPKVSLRDGLKE